jgi:hypothetical protein
MFSGNIGEDLADAVRRSRLTLYDSLEARQDLIYPTEVLEARLARVLCGLDLAFPIRTRSRVAKSAVAEALGYPVPRSFRKERPRFPGQNLDVYVQKSDNLQVWNDEISPSRRYAILRVGEMDKVVAVRVLSGEALALLDRTGTLTSKFQAARIGGRQGTVLVTNSDTENLVSRLRPETNVPAHVLAEQSATMAPRPGETLAISEVFRRLGGLSGAVLTDPGHDQERLRGVELQRLVCRLIGVGRYADGGQFPDILSQALEVKLQLSPTIDLGLVSPDSTHAAVELGAGLSHCDVRYVVVYARREDVNHLLVVDYVVSTGESFFTEFRRFEGRVTNGKLQIPLPRSLFLTRC